LLIQVVARFSGSFLLVATPMALQGNASGRRTAAADSNRPTDSRGCGMQLHRGRPLGDDRFVARLEALAGRPLAPQKRGPKPKTKRGRDAN
jgi:hypothetical protein